MLRRAAVLASLVLVACPSSNERGDAQTPAAGHGTGPLANLESSPFLNEVFTTEDGQQIQFVYYTRENLRISSTCRLATGELTCDAIRYLRNGMPVEIPRRALDGRTSGGVKVCQRLNQPLVMVRNAMMSEDSMCRFPDGSLVSTGALEQYAMRVMQ